MPKRRALNNAQGELHPLEVGMHALKSGFSQAVYGKQMGLSQQSISLRSAAAAVAVVALTTHVVADLADRWRHLAEIHAAPRWLWKALVGALIERSRLGPGAFGWRDRPPSRNVDSEPAHEGSTLARLRLSGHRGRTATLPPRCDESRRTSPDR